MLLLSLFFSALISASIFPFASEVVFIAALDDGLSPVVVLIVATSGNTLGAMLTWWLAGLARDGKLGFKLKPSSARASELYDRFGTWTLLLSWLPIIGDAFPGLAGWFKLSFWQTISLVAVAKFGRYLALMAAYFAW